MECINCTQCIDACNQVMKKIGREPNLIRYSSQARDRGQQASLFRARTAIYPVMLVGILTAFFSVFLLSKTFDAVILREPGNPHVMTEDGRVRNMLKLKLTNRTDEPMTFAAQVLEPSNAELELQESSMDVPARETRTFHVSAIAPREAFLLGRAGLHIDVANEQEVSRTIKLKMIGPYE